MAAALLELAHPGTAAAAEKDDRLGHHRAVLGETERQRVDPDAPGDVGGGAAEKGDGIGEARAVHVQLQSLALGDLAEHGRASCGERVCRDVCIWVVARSLKKK